MDFNERTVVDFPRTGFRYQRQPTKKAKRLKDADIDRVDGPLKSLLANDSEFLPFVKTVLAKLVDTFFILTVNAHLLAIAIYHLRKTRFFIVSRGALSINKDFEFNKSNYTPEAMIDTLRLVKSSKEYMKFKEEEGDEDKSERYIARTIVNIFRYQRFLVEYFSDPEVMK